MKKGNLFLTLIFVAMAVLVGVGSMVATFAQAENLALRATADDATPGITLFDGNGNYAVARNTLTKGNIYNFFGYDWYLVNLNDKEEVATFWMVEPYQDKKYTFNHRPQQSATIDSDYFKNGDTLWYNGYTKSVWNDKTFADSDLKVALQGEIATAIIDGDKDANAKHYKDRVKAGYVPGSNSNNDEAVRTITQVYVAESDLTDHRPVNATDESGKPYTTLTAHFDLGENDKLWVPSTEEIMDGGIWGLTNNERNWNVTTTDKVCWLRNPVTNDSAMAQLVGYKTSISNADLGEETVTFDQSIYKHSVDKAHGVRPAIHMSLENYGYNGGNGNGSGDGKKGGWFTDDMMKVFFIIICVLGVIGVVLVIIAVVAKARRDKAADGQQNA